MKELLKLLLGFKFKELFFEPTENGMIQFFRYAFVGGIATVVDWGIQFFVTELGVHYLISAMFAFVGGLACNFVLSKIFVFKAEKTDFGIAAEFASYALIGLVGLGFTMGIMYFFTDIVSLNYMISKVIATVTVLIWNFLARKIFVYGNKK